MRDLLKIFVIGGILPAVIYSCRTQVPMTEQLFMQHKRVNIDYPPEKGNGGGILSEQVSYTTFADTAGLEVDDTSSKLDTNKVYNLAGVTVSSKLRFTSVREGHVNVDFVIRVPKELVSDNYRMKLTPELIYGDTAVQLEHVVLMGKNFMEKQEQDYKNYEDFLSTIIPEEQYNDTFLDRKGIENDMRLRQNLYRELYSTEHKRVSDYWEWREKTQERFNFFNSRKEIRRRNMYHKYQRDGNFDAIVKLTLQQDTVGTSDTYSKKFMKRVKRDPYFKIHREIKEKTVPKKYRDLFHSGTRPTEVQNFAVSELDSIQISNHRYFYDQIVMNEMKDSLRDEVFTQTVPYQRINGDSIKYNLTITEPIDFSYLYTQEYEVKPGMKNLQVHLKGRIDAVDESGFSLAKTDTLNFLISSLEELADYNLLEAKISDYQYQEGYDYLVNRDYLQAMKILGDYNDYNMALSLACQGYNQQAYALLRRQPETALVHYLNAIVSSRLGLKTEAVSSLEKACTLDTSMIYRCMRDAEIKKLIYDFNLQERLDQIEFMSLN